MEYFLTTLTFENSSINILLAVFSVALLWGVYLWAERITKNKLAREALETKTKIDDLLVNIIKHLHPLFILGCSAYIITLFLATPAFLETILFDLFLISLVFQSLYTIHLVIKFIFKNSQQSNSHQKAYSMLSVLAAIVLWSVGLLFLLSNLGFDITALVAGLGITGVAMAFASQNILRDLFSYITILLDQPIRVGDTISVAGKEGVVSHIGIKTTRIKSPDEQEIIVSNDTIATGEIENFGRTNRRRVKFHVYAKAPVAQTFLENFTTLVLHLAKAQPVIELTRAHVRGLTPVGVCFEFTYYIESRDYTLYREEHHKLLVALHKLFKAKKVVLAEQPVDIAKSNV